MKELFAPLTEMAEFPTILEAVSRKREKIHIIGPAETQKAHLIAALIAESGKRGAVISWSESAARQIAEDLAFFSEHVAYLPQGDFMTQWAEGVGKDLAGTRSEALYRITIGDTAVLSVGCLLDCTLPAKAYHPLSVKVGNTVEGLPEKLTEMGYQRVPMIEGQGQFAVRGGIVDVFSSTESQPIRIELFDAEVDNIRRFDLETQRSVENLEETVIAPFSSEMSDGDILDYFGEDTIFILDEPRRVSEGAEAYTKAVKMKVAELVMQSKTKEPKAVNIQDYAVSLAKMEKAVVCGFSAISQGGMEKPTVTVQLPSVTIASYAGKMDLLCEDVERWRKNQYRIYIMAGGENRAKGIMEALAERKIPTEIGAEDVCPARGIVAVFELPLGKGFIYPPIKTVFISGGDVFLKKNRKKRGGLSGAKALRSFDELKPGDFVVHRVHGIGRFITMEKIETDHVERDYLKIEYKNHDMLYVPVTQLNLLYKYSHAGEETAPPRVNRLGGGEWQKTKSGVKHSVRQLAIKLVDLYAARSQMTGHAFLKDTPWQSEFESTFPYEETPDQITAVAEVKSDMEKPKPMDRLLCGDVGYGKTEVAIRAAFKCVMEGMQCAYLVPTTILAAQHYNHFVERMKDFPLRVEMLSRFRTAAQQKKIIAGLASGEVDIIIGTHRLLGDDVQYKKLGLLIIDEEQRFGVGDKEKIKDMKKGIDVLTMTATPIPRTLNMAMTGIRDMSVLSNPPEERQPIQTYVFEYDATVVRDAVERELERGGQVFYVFNRVQGIYRVADSLQKLVPEARIVVAHGRMNEEELENAMMKMMHHEADLLVCTTIIESGIDIPNVNTLIVENADHIGLAQLYQLRGRVGRSNRIAYAYLTFRRDKSLSEVAEKRLLAIKEFTELGSGFKIALRDLEIRGAGNLLGPEQHGFLSSVGYDMYVRLLEEAVAELRGEEGKTEAVIDLTVDAGIPDAYIEDTRQRLEAYRMIAEIGSEEEAVSVTDVLIDRFGEPPARTLRLIDVALLRVYAEAAGIGEVTQSGGKVIMYYDKKPNMERVSAVIAENRGGILFGAGERPYLALRENFLKNVNDTKKIKKLLKDLKN
ncbi:MAG: transcription-repair coupling factor [Clostridia bacterium]|nr:transcription-repair coupling factor [Clostridia bacterium]